MPLRLKVTTEGCRTRTYVNPPNANLILANISEELCTPIGELPDLPDPLDMQLNLKYVVILSPHLCLTTVEVERVA